MNVQNRTPVGNYYLTNELHCSTISENDVYSILSFKEILNKDVKAEIKREKSVSDGFKTDLFSAISL